MVMNEIVKVVLSLSMSGSILAMIILATKPFISRKLSKSIQYYLWMIILLRLTLPFSFESSIMNGLFFGNQQAVVTTAEEQRPLVSIDKNVSKSTNVQKNTVSSINKGDSKKYSYFLKLFNKYALYLWLLGFIASFIINLAGYTKFLKYIKKSNIPANIWETEMLNNLLSGRYNVRLSRNPSINTPMLIGIVKPFIIIPDTIFNETQIKNILLHEIVHLKRFDIWVKWLTMIASAIHWFNPLMYLIKKEINNSCELACDEVVIKNFNPIEKQEYGDTLISVVAHYKYPIGILQVTMCEDKKNLKERLVAIMQHNTKSKPILIFSVILLVSLISGAIFLGAGVGNTKNVQEQQTKVTLRDSLIAITKYKTPYLGDNNKVSPMVSNLPIPDSYFKQKYISIETDKKPYKLNVFYEIKDDVTHIREFPIVPGDDATLAKISKNALILFCMIDNLDEVTFSFRGSQSNGKLEPLKYNYSYSFIRRDYEKKYGDLTAISGKLDLLQVVVSKEIRTNKIATQTPKVN
jgi:beta-lactamase regulating signal transducer with metallopeptidase domain